MKEKKKRSASKTKGKKDKAESDPDYNPGEDQPSSSLESTKKIKRIKIGSGDESKNNYLCQVILPTINIYGDETTFDTMDQVSDRINLYEERTLVQLRIHRSDFVKTRARTYACVTHVGCPFFLKFGSRRRDGAIVLKSYNARHYGDVRALKAADGRKWKGRHARKYDEEYNQISTRKAGPVLSADLVKTIQNQRGIDISYNSSWRLIQQKKMVNKSQVQKTFQMIPSYADAFSEINMESVCDYVIDESTHRLQRFFLMPSYINDIFKCLPPCISIDAAALKGPGKGVLMIYSATTGNRENYILAFGIKEGNENKAGWDYTNNIFHKHMACLQNTRTDTLEDIDTLEFPLLSIEEPEEVQVSEIVSTSHDAFFQSDRDKGIEASLKQYFPHHHAAKCARHIQADVAVFAGKQVSKAVISIAKTFSAKQEEYLLEKIGKTNKKAENYLRKIKPELWRGAAQMQDDNIPPRFGFTTSNAAECTNSISLILRNSEPWLGVIEGMVDIMSSANSKRRQLYKESNPNDVVPWVREVLELRSKAAASMEILQIEESRDEYCVTEVYNKFIELDEYEGISKQNKNSSENVVELTERKTRNVLHPSKKWCTCGKWQDMKFPCRHAMTYFIKWKGYQLNKILQEEVHYYFRYKALQVLYERNVCPKKLKNQMSKLWKTRTQC